MGSYNVLSRMDALKLFGKVDGAAQSFAIRPESVVLLKESAESLGTDRRIAAGMIRSVSILGNVIRYGVEAAGVRLTIDALNDGRTLPLAERSLVLLALDESQLLQLEKEGA
ncbi:TOBE domain-containing protein [Cohnella rhizosphaerae]|uniref:TOBE domain-containing protein n=2 Tax=Cohnella rhizosphaerae TaxID=1457232 RepID=A0A9X4QTT5_9BACL|nr:TOBE domain-containing protein [Cohnella rhizosphaerae]